MFTAFRPLALRAYHGAERLVGRKRVFVLHIPRTGGTFVHQVLMENQAHWQRPLTCLTRMQSLRYRRRQTGQSAPIAFTFRDPALRFLSAFNSRLRQGRPEFTHQVWDAGEAAAYYYFSSATDLAEALVSQDDRIYSAAQTAMRFIRHLRMDHRAYLGDPDTLYKNRNQIVACVETAHLDDRLPAFLSCLGLPTFTLPTERKTLQSPTPSKPLSALAVLALKQHWQYDYEIYELCREISADRLG